MPRQITVDCFVALTALDGDEELTPRLPVKVTFEGEGDTITIVTAVPRTAMTNRSQKLAKVTFFSHQQAGIPVIEHHLPQSAPPGTVVTLG